MSEPKDQQPSPISEETNVPLTQETSPRPTESLTVPPVVRHRQICGLATASSGRANLLVSRLPRCNPRNRLGGSLALPTDNPKWGR